MNITDEIRRLIRQVRDLEDRVRDLESDCDSYEVKEPQVGFEVPDGSDDFDEDSPEYRG